MKKASYQRTHLPQAPRHLLWIWLLMTGVLGWTHGSVLAQTPINGDASGTLDLMGSPYLVTNDLTVPEGQTLVIEPGVVLQFQDTNDGLNVEGTLVAQGTADSRIVFTTADADASPGQWQAPPAACPRES